MRPVPEGPQPQLLGDAGQLAVPSMLCRRCCAVVLRPRTTTSARTDFYTTAVLGIKKLAGEEPLP